MTSCGRSNSGHGWRAATLAAALSAITPAAPAQVAPNQVATKIDVVGTRLRVQLPDGSVREGAALVGATLVVAVGRETIRVRIAGVERDTSEPSGEILLYDFRQVAPAGETPLCEPDPEGRRLGLPLAGRSDAAGILSPAENGVFELVCTSGPQGKCVRFGYAPWRQTPDGRPMRDWYNACVRMVRADYCGDGRAYTRDGTLIAISDRLDIQRTHNDPSTRFEAAWGPAGAVCVAHTRIPENIDLDRLARICPRLKGRLGPDACRDDAPGGLVFNRSR